MLLVSANNVCSWKKGKSISELFAFIFLITHLMQGDREDPYQGGFRSPPYDDVYDRRYSDRSSSGGRSPGYDQESRQYNDYKRSPGQPEVVNDWRREDRFGNGKKFDDHRIPDGESKVGGSPERPKDVDTSSPPVVRPVREILGENIVPLRIIEPPKGNGSRADGSAQTQVILLLGFGSLYFFASVLLRLVGSNICN